MKYLLPLLLFLTGLTCSAQQLNTTSFYELYTVLHNPATAGSAQHGIIGASFKTQWQSIPGSPKTALVYGQTFLSSSNLGVGGYLYHDVTGPTSRTGLQMAYAYHIRVKEKSSLSFGLEARLQQLRFDMAKLLAELGGIDPVTTDLSNRQKADAGFGIAYTSPKWQVGASVTQLLQTKYKLYEVAGTLSEQSRFYRHYYLHAAYKWKSDEATHLIPNVLFIYLPNAPLEIQTGLRVAHDDLLWYGLNWRWRQGWMVAAGVKLKKKFSIGYSFDLYKSPRSIYEKGSTGHELLLLYELL
jgi:type IX secretion system PorP/SprF family membrane protein